MITLDDIRKPVTAELEALDEFVDRQFTAEGELLSDMLRYALSARGKGIRPMLVMLSAAMNAPVKGAAAGRRACLAAMLVEMIHVASLIHDDVIDEADMRRGKPSANARWQSHKAVILGDYILAKNMNIGLQSGQFDLVTHVCGSMAALCEGEVLQDECAANSTMMRLLIISTRLTPEMAASPQRDTIMVSAMPTVTSSSCSPSSGPTSSNNSRWLNKSSRPPKSGAFVLCFVFSPMGFVPSKICSLILCNTGLS